MSNEPSIWPHNWCVSSTKSALKPPTRKKSALTCSLCQPRIWKNWHMYRLRMRPRRNWKRWKRSRRREHGTRSHCWHHRPTRCCMWRPSTRNRWFRIQHKSLRPIVSWCGTSAAHTSTVHTKRCHRRPSLNWHRRMWRASLPSSHHHNRNRPSPTDHTIMLHVSQFTVQYVYLSIYLYCYCECH